jgi:hypothetical protein
MDEGYLSGREQDVCRPGVATIATFLPPSGRPEERAMMRPWAVLGTLVSLLLGPPAAVDRTDDADPGPRVGGAVERPLGFRVEAGSFYVWDEDRQVAERWAVELADSLPRGPRS